MPFKLGLAAVAGLRAATKIVAAFNSLDKTRADFVCDGVNDQVEINNAIAALGETGGTVLLLEGTYYITASITLASNVALVGQGAGTVLKIPNGFDDDINVISGSNINRVRVANLKVDGNKANQEWGDMYGIYFNTVTFSKVTNCWCENIRRHGIFLYTSSNNTVTGNTCAGNSWDGISVMDSSNNNTITGNTCLGSSGGIRLGTSNHNTVMGNACQGNGVGIGLGTSNNNTVASNRCCGNGEHGIFLGTSSNNAVTGNPCNGNEMNGIYLVNSCCHNTVTGNTCMGNSEEGIWLEALCKSNTIADNTCQGNGCNGIWLWGSYDYDAYTYRWCDNNTIVGNTVHGNNGSGIRLDRSNHNTITGNTSLRNRWEGIRIDDSSNNTIAGNTLLENSQYGNKWTDNIKVQFDSNYNYITSNVCRKGGLDNKPKYGINITGGTGNVVHGNDLFESGADGDLNDAGAGTLKRDNRRLDGTDWLGET